MTTTLTNYCSLLSKEILENQICTVCKKYLSYPPTKIYPNGEIKCGRCAKENDFGVVSTLNKVTENLVFPCVNSYEGCNYWLGCTEVARHEETCKGGLHKCPICPENKSTSESTLSLINHFKINHNRVILKNPVLQIITKNDLKQYYFYYNQHLNLVALFFLQIHGHALFVNVSTVGPIPELVKTKIQIFESYPELLLLESSWKACSLWNSNIDGMTFQLKNDLSNFSMAFEFQTPNTMIQFVTNCNETNSLQMPLEIHVPEVKKDNKKKQSNENSNSTPSSSSNNVSTENIAILQHPAKRYKNHFWTEKDMIPKFYLDNLPNNYLKQNLKNPIFSDCGKFIVDKKGNHVLDIRCSFCENYYVTINNYPYIDKCYNYNNSTCNFSFCMDCSDITDICPRCFSKIDKYYDTIPCFTMNYFCRYFCGQYFDFDHLVSHETGCNKNPYNYRSDCYFGDSFILGNIFGINFYPWADLSQNNVFRLDDCKFNNKGRIYVVDQKGYHFCLDFIPTEWNNIPSLRFNIYHEYDPGKYQIITRILENNTIKDEYNELYFFYLDRNDKTAFSIIFKEVQQ